MALLYLRAALFLCFLSQSSALRVLNSSELRCALEDVPCKAEFNNCFYEEWMKQQDYTPSAPRDLRAKWDVRVDENGDLVPVIVAQWNAMDDGSIFFLKGNQLQVMKLDTSEHLCIQNTLSEGLSGMRSPTNELWPFFVDQMVVDPGFNYSVSISNLPKPNSGQSNYDIRTFVAVPDCSHPVVQKTKFCIETGSFWQPNITMKRTGADDRTLLVSFNTGELSENYYVFVRCGDDKHRKQILNKDKMSLLNITFDLDAWPHTCCKFSVQIQPFFTKCKNDCTRKNRFFNICPEAPAPLKESKMWLVFAGLFLLFSGLVVFAACLCRRKQQRNRLENEPLIILPTPSHPVPPHTHSVLILYSRDHPKYTDIVLKLCAFLRAKCGIQVYLDLLDTTSVGVMGRLQWTEQHMRLIEQTSNKVLVLCSRGVQAKWGAMCGGPRVYLREDVQSPMGDMLTLALQLITPDMQHPASYGKYLVAYFDDICGEQDVPSMLDVAVKYKLMKHFETLYFRILDREQYQPGKINTIEGLGIDEYFNCDSGKALKDAIEIFQAYQVENPDWFEEECCDSEDEVIAAESIPFIDENIPPVLTCEPVINIGPPVLKHGVEIHPIDLTEDVRTSEIPNLNLDVEEPSMLGIQPVLSQVYSIYPSVEPPPGIHTSGVYPALIDTHSCLLAEPALHELLPPNQNELYVKDYLPSDDCERRSVDAMEALQQLQLSLMSSQIPAPPPSMVDHNQPEERDESEMEEASGKRQSRWSDQGYSSRDSNSNVREEPPAFSLADLAKLQEVLYLNSPISSGFCTET
ncbi:interleukin 17 receptor A1a [Astyanax mexicanus]|uniref:interleukin 17 receptor A1a n=1 Tax=Astyanax mexicanus TaxID=7994 RepID=UPI0020CB073B|nr:interleukin 17 receptor A1a [Astyanax mexicanus]